MRTITFGFAAILLTATLSVAAQESMQYTPVSCIRAGELPLMQIRVEGEGDLRGYFRRINSSDWCSVAGVNDGPLSRVVLPKFEAGDEIEYFFVLLDGRRVAARSDRIYRVRVSSECELPSARHLAQLLLSCGDDAQGIPSSLGAGMALSSNFVAGEPPPFSPDTP